jgi:hypothetical protein
MGCFGTRSVQAIFLGLSLTVSSPIHSQERPVGASQHTWVTNGVFELKEGESKDVTDRGILLHLTQVIANDGRASRLQIMLNGSGYSPMIGTRYDLKNLGQTKEFVKDFRTCVLDVVSAKAPVGGQASAVFRQLCQ